LALELPPKLKLLLKRLTVDRKPDKFGNTGAWLGLNITLQEGYQYEFLRTQNKELKLVGTFRRALNFISAET